MGKNPGLDFVGPTTVVIALEKTKKDPKGQSKAVNIPHVHALGFLVTPAKWEKQQLFTPTRFQGFMSALTACSIEQYSISAM